MNETEVLIIGGGPVGLALALDLRSRGVSCLVLETTDGRVRHPRVGTVGPRSMELMRRWGLAERIRKTGWPGDHSLDIAWVTAVGGHEIHRLGFGTTDTRPALPYTPEPEQVCPQHWLLPLLAEAVGPEVLRRECRLESFVQDDDQVLATVTDLADGSRLDVGARYLVGCDGAASRVRTALRIAAPPRRPTRVFRNILFRAPRLREQLGPDGALVYFLTQPPDLRYPLRAMNGRDLYRLTVGHHTSADPIRAIRSAIALKTPVEVLSDNVWHLTHRVAERYRHGRVLLAGDAAHTLSPSGGFGMNTGIADAADLGWKLAAELTGWAGPALLDSYEQERRPVAELSLTEADGNLRRTLDRRLPTEILLDTAQGATARTRLARAIERSGVRREFEAPDMHFGYRYASPVIVPDGRTAYDWCADLVAGGRAPHVRLGYGASSLDLFGHGFHLVASDPRPDLPALDALARAFGARRVPFALTRAPLYASPYALVRPDGHVAWHGAELPADPGALVDTVRGERR
ncbi:FAD-dependent monooxygenase [Streptomyces sp. NPDC048665]|uniref:FAD-dependent monooxygenase n=1 Tax=Streptomyces sp. NPDC048665 TaxID=3155490 RepID=UPI003432BBA5